MSDSVDKAAEYIKKTREQYTREAIEMNLLAQGYSIEDVSDGWKKVEQEDAAAIEQPKERVTKNPSFWVILIVYVLVGPFVIGLLSGILQRAGVGGKSYFSEFESFTNGLLIFGILFVGNIAGAFALQSKIRWLAIAMVWGSFLIFLIAFIPPFIITGICTAGYNITKSG